MNRLLLLHGFTQTAASWNGPATWLRRAGLDVLALDLPGHGSGTGTRRQVEGDLWSGASAIADRAGRGIWIGYSMGARLALHLTLAHPEAVEGLVLLGGTAGIDDEAERRARRDHDEVLADRIEIEGVDAFLDDWLAQPLFSALPDDSEELAGRRTNTAEGLASSLRRWGTGTMDPPLWDRLSEISAPTLVLAGANDPKFTALGRRLTGSIGSRATFAKVPGAGHAAHLEQPKAFAGIVGSWLAGHDPG